MKRKKNIYIFSYMLSIIVICMLNMFSVTDALNGRLNLPLTDNPIYFLIVDTIILSLIMQKVKKEAYPIQQRVIQYFTTINNLFLFIALLLSCSFLSILVNMITNIFLVYLLRPMTVSSNIVNGVDEYFGKYNRDIHKFYNDMEEIKQEYHPLKKEIEVEIPGLEVKIKESKKDKKRRVIYITLPIIVITLFLVGVVFSIVEILKTFERAQYNAYEVTLNQEPINMYYEENFYNVVIPIFYIQKESRTFYTTNDIDKFSNIITMKQEYILELKEYECYNNDKGHDIKISCDGEALSERKEEIALVSSKMTITHNDTVIYDGNYISNITKYIQKPGKYVFHISNKRNKISTNIKFVIEIVNEIAEG